jgi:hypothetical protein
MHVQQEEERGRREDPRRKVELRRRMASPRRPCANRMLRDVETRCPPRRDLGIMVAGVLVRSTIK